MSDMLTHIRALRFCVSKNMKKLDILEVEDVKPAESLRAEFFPDRRLKGILVRDVENTPENLGKISGEIQSVSDLVIMRPLSPTKNVTDVLYYIECKEEGCEEVIASRIEKLGISKEVIILDLPDERFALSVFFPILTLGERSIVFRESLCRGLINGLRERMGEAAAKAFLHIMGMNIGRDLAESLKNALGDKSLKECLKILVSIAGAQGFFLPEKIEVKPGSIIIDIRENWEAVCLDEKYRNRGPQCFWTKGALKGILQLTHATWDVEEVKCLANRDPACRLIASKFE